MKMLVELKAILNKIVSIELNNLIKRLGELKLRFTFDDTLVNHISKVGFDDVYGARPIKRAIQDEVEDLISELVLNGDVLEDKNYKITVLEDIVTVK